MCGMIGTKMPRRRRSVKPDRRVAIEEGKVKLLKVKHHRKKRKHMTRSDWAVLRNYAWGVSKSVPEMPPVITDKKLLNRLIGDGFVEGNVHTCKTVISPISGSRLTAYYVDGINYTDANMLKLRQEGVGLREYYPAGYIFPCVQPFLLEVS